MPRGGAGFMKPQSEKTKAKIKWGSSDDCECEADAIVETKGCESENDDGFVVDRILIKEYRIELK